MSIKLLRQLIVEISRYKKETGKSSWGAEDLKKYVSDDNDISNYAFTMTSLNKIGVNPVVQFPGEGPVLFGDKTLQSKPSAFDRINVRRLFIVLEQAISQAAKFSLFEFNDSFTQSQFVSLVTPFLRDVQGRRGITDFKVVCDSTNNTAQVVNANQFVGDIYIKPAHAINYIQLNFVAVGSNVDFNTIVAAA